MIELLHTVHQEPLPSVPAPPVSGWQIAGVIANTIAVLVALGIALASRVQQRNDREREALAQARLVIAHLGGGDRDGPVRGTATPQTYLGFTFENHSERPVLDAYAEYWTDDKKVTDPPHAVHQPIVEARDRIETMALLMEGTAGDDFRMTSWRVRWTDADGRQWFRDPSTSLEPARYTGRPPARP